MPYLAPAAAAVLATKTYLNVGADVDIATFSTSFVDIDATNLAVSFTAPASGSVVVLLSGTQYHSSDQGDQGFWVLRNGSSSVGVAISVTNTSRLLATSVAIPVSGLTPGTAYTLKWGHSTQNSPTAQHFYIKTNTAATMAVLPA